MSGGLILWQPSNALINGCYLHPLVYDGHLLHTPQGPIGDVEKSGSAQVAASEEKVADREKSGNLGPRRPPYRCGQNSLLSLSSGGSAATGSGRAYGTALPFLHTHVHERAVGGRREAVSCFCTGMRRGGRPGELNQLKNENVAGELSHFFVLSSRENYSWTL